MKYQRPHSVPPGRCLLCRCLLRTRTAERAGFHRPGGEDRCTPGGVLSCHYSSAVPLSNSQLLGYRAAVADLVREASRRLGPSNLAAVERLVAERLGQREFACVRPRLDEGVGATAQRLMREIRLYRPSTRSSASDLPPGRTPSAGAPGGGGACAAAGPHSGTLQDSNDSTRTEG
jgi:hypothetical protein